ncbi:hypothetical protein BC749_108240 [Flavobacterium araucananum]|uniref:Uncharacterized protein n=1 Tax=Flavobacterium araucananum TaxID=946678 RepID=A0A227NK12_9FLAO|nr:hypothetical protein [Flavobacterium araucananum]OXE97148.1 hypothetical protein B0A64_23550 [Flavobacterium araucananum]PWJ97089.1 hypothetical protein BC749_108240 [Flavobacterium araucananum]
MKKLLLILVFLLGQVASAQDSKRASNFIITIDENIITTLANSKIILSQGNNIVRTIQFTYYPGSLSMNQADYDEIMKFEGTILLKFDYYEYLKDEQKIINYEIETGKIWFEQPYLILKIYNTNKKKYRKLEPLKGKEYTFELQYSTGQMLRIRKK